MWKIISFVSFRLKNIFYRVSVSRIEYPNDSTRLSLIPTIHFPASPLYTQPSVYWALTLSHCELLLLLLLLLCNSDDSKEETLDLLLNFLLVDKDAAAVGTTPERRSFPLRAFADKYVP